MNVKVLASFSAALSIFYGGVVARAPGAEPKPPPSMAFSASVIVTCLPCPLWRKANNFCGLSEFLLYYVATIKLVYNENIL
jgi:hypothetical protein